MVTISPDRLLSEFKSYVDRWRQLDNEYARIPSWRIFKQLRNIRQRESLTRLYVAKMKRWGLDI